MRAFALVIAAVGAAASACASAISPVVPGSGTAPMPPNVRIGRAAVTPSPTGGDTSCDPTASYRPTGPLPSPGQMPAGSTMARILARGRLIAGVDQTMAPFGYRDALTGQIQGFDIDMVHQIAQAIFGNPNKVELRPLTAAERIPALQSGQVDIIADQLTQTCARWQLVDFTTTYFTDWQRIMVDKGSGIGGVADLAGKRVCAPSGTLSLQQVALFPSHPTPVGVDNWTDCLVMLQQHQVDAISTDDGILAGLVAQDPGTEMVGPGINEEPHGLAIAKQNVDFVRFVNAVLAQMRSDGAWRTAYNTWVEPYLGPGSTPPAALYRD